MKRFWKEASVIAQDGGFGVALDGKLLKTPAKGTLACPNRAMADAIAAEWDAAKETVEPASMPMTRYANTALDRVASNFEDIAEQVAAYGGSDLLCYRAAHPDELIARQAEAWDPLLSWANEMLGVTFILAQGVMHVEQPASAAESFTTVVKDRDAFSLAALHDLTALSGSLVIALAVVHDRLAVDDAWRTSRVDEDWQIEQWGEDDLARDAAAAKRRDFEDAARFLGLASMRAE